MVHSKPEYAESVKSLTYSQLRRLEKIDAKKDRDAKLLEIGRTAVEASGRAAQGLFSNQITGTATFILAAAALYPAWEPIVYTSLSTLVKDLGDAWRSGVVPALESIQPSGHPPPASFTLPDGTILGWGIEVQNQGVTVSGRGRWYNNQAERDLAYTLLQLPGAGIAAGDLIPAGPGTGYAKWREREVTVNGVKTAVIELG